MLKIHRMRCAIVQTKLCKQLKALRKQGEIQNHFPIHAKTFQESQKKKKRTLIEYFERKRTLKDKLFPLSLIVDPKERFF